MLTAVLLARLAGAVSVGAPAPAVTLVDAERRPLPLETLRGKVVCLDFWATWCAVCKTALPGLDAIARRHAGRGLEVVAVGIDGDPALAERVLRERLPDAALRAAYDPSGSVFSTFRARGMPALYLIDRAGVVRLVESGYEPGRLDAVEREIERLLDGDVSGAGGAP
ncbi:MAG TPA: TlpA disulfide reductase family protein [Candidatus Binatia bacterium]|nr:TlpA disulfide reductase family protein [Candidatus Binatia bacterium]